MTEAFIVDAVRTPVAKGKPGGAYADIHPADLLAHPLRALVERTGIDPAQIDDVISGTVSQAGEQGGNPVRWATLAAGFPESVPGTTVNRACGSSQQAVSFAAAGIVSGQYDLVVAAGVESMSHVPIGSASLGRDTQGAGVAARYPDGLVPQGVSAELIAEKWGLTREQLDAFALESHAKAAAAWAAGRFDREVVQVPGHVLERDETIRTGTTSEQMANLRAAFRTEEFERRFPSLDWRVTAGNSSPVNDGAGAMLLASGDTVERLGLTPRARIHTVAVTGDDPLLMLTGVIPATEKVLTRSGLDLSDIDAFEVNEAFASVVLSWAAETGADLAKVNLHGGATAIGHPLGASGVRLMSTLLSVLEQTGGRYGLQTMCEAGGMANATIIERV